MRPPPSWKQILNASLAVALAGSLAAQEPRVLTQHNDNYRTGANLNERILNTTNVNASRFGKILTRSVDGYIYAQPLYVPNLAIGNTIRNVVFVATEHDSVYAFDADDPAASQPLWHVNLGPSVPSATIACPNLLPEIGITSTPVIDEASGTLYVEAMTQPLDEVEHWLHALDLRTGAEKPGSPVPIGGFVEGSGDGSVGGVIQFTANLQLNRPGLTLANGAIYIAFGSFCDFGPYHGWVFTYDQTSLQQLRILATTPGGSGGGVWQSGQGLSVGDDGSLFLMTGNGSFDRSTIPPTDLGDTFVKLNQSLSVIDWFTPFNQADLQLTDTDLGSAGPLLIPNTNLLISGGKEGKLYLLDRSQMGHFNEAFDDVVQSFFVQRDKQIHGSPIFWNSPAGPQIYVWGEEDVLKAYRMVGLTFRTTPVSTSQMPPTAHGRQGGFLSLSANGRVPGSGIVWASLPLADAGEETVPGILRAFDASDLSRELWNSNQNQARDVVGNFAKFCPPTVANGKIYLATFSGTLNVYGLLP